MSTRRLCQILAQLSLVSPLLAACAGAPPPTSQLAVAGSTISEAETAGAVQYAPVPLKQAKQELASAQAASSNGRYEMAQRLATEAEADAKLAEVTTQASLAEQSANAVQQGITTLRQEAAPPPPAPSVP
jgi:Domain of unknown function (DUF4398)